MAKIPRHTPKILERSLATRQRSLKEAKRPEYLRCGQGSFKDLWGVARDLYHFCVPGGTLDVSPTQKWQRSLATPQRSLKALATRQRSLKEAKRPEYLTCGQGQASAAAACRSMPQHAAACRSMPQRLFFGAALGGFEACRSMPQHAAASQNFHVADFFFHTTSKL